MKSIIAFFRELVWYMNGLYTGISLTIFAALTAYVLTNPSEKTKKKRKKIETQ